MQLFKAGRSAQLFEATRSAQLGMRAGMCPEGSNRAKEKVSNEQIRTPAGRDSRAFGPICISPNVDRGSAAQWIRCTSPKDSSA
jgi:hypothetical protein